MTKKEKEEHLLKSAFSVFVKNKIEGSTFNMIAEEANVGVATLYRHYTDKFDLAIKVCGMCWKNYLDESLEKRTKEYVDTIPAIDRLIFTLDMYIDLYVNHKELLLYNDNFNHYIVHEHVEKERLEKYFEVMDKMTERFHWMYERAKIDKTFRTDLPEEYLMRVTLHTMMGACNHYAGGLLWGAENDSDYSKELIELKEMIIDFVTKGC